MSKRVRRTRNAGTMTEAAFWGFVRASLKQLWLRQWKPRKDALNHHSRYLPHATTGKRLKHTQCQHCRQWFPQKERAIQVHHIVEVGHGRNAQEIGGWVERLFCEEELLLPLCKPCHDKETARLKRG